LIRTWEGKGQTTDLLFNFTKGFPLRRGFLCKTDHVIAACKLVLFGEPLYVPREEDDIGIRWTARGHILWGKLEACMQSMDAVREK